MGWGNAEGKDGQVVPTAPTHVTGRRGNDWCFRIIRQKEHSKTLPGSQINISERKEPQMGQSRGKLRGQDMQGMCGCHCSVSLLGAGRSISLSLQYGARGRVGLHATLSSPNTLFLKSCSPKLVHLSS